MTAAARSILIVGGGTAGWMAAAYLGRRTNCEITLVESPDVGTIGVGEATIPSMVAFVRNMGFDEGEFMRRCQATYKLGIKFVDWVRPDHATWHPFGITGTIDDVDVFHFWLKGLRDGGDTEPYSAYSLQALLGDAEKSPRPLQGSSIVVDRGAYAYHLDAAAMAGYLKEIATGQGVTHHADNVTRVALDDRGFIEHVETEKSGRLSADLYVDCTGFRGLLIEDALGDPWIDWSGQLLCDRAVVVRLPPDGRMHPYTRSTALAGGWAWTIPLSRRVGCGYVYSSGHVSDRDATRELMSHARGIPFEEPRRLKMRVGRRTNFWAANCVSVGLASGFLEPLESTGIYFIDKALELLVEYFPDRHCTPALARAYNARMADSYDGIRDFVLLHYLVSQRDDTAFWRDCRNVGVPDSLHALLETYDETGIVEPRRDRVFPDVSFHHILSGAGRLPRRHLPRADFSDFGKVREFMYEIKKRNLELAEQLPDHRAVMQALHGLID